MSSLLRGVYLFTVRYYLSLVRRSCAFGIVSSNCICNCCIIGSFVMPRGSLDDNDGSWIKCCESSGTWAFPILAWVIFPLSSDESMVYVISWSWNDYIHWSLPCQVWPPHGLTHTALGLCAADPIGSTTIVRGKKLRQERRRCKSKPFGRPAIR